MGQSIVRKRVISLFAGGSGGYVGPTNDLGVVISQINPPPGAPTLGDRYLINTAPTGAWVGHANEIAEWDGAAWVYTVPVLDDIVFITNTLTTKRFNGTLWVAYTGTAILQNGNNLGTNIIVGANSNHALQFKSNATVRGQFINNGQFNIANNSYFGNISTAASARVHIKGSGNTSATTALRIDSSTVNSILTVLNNGALGVNISPTATAHFKGAGNTSSTFSMRVASTTVADMFNIRDNGFVGINYDDPTAWLHIKSGANTGIKMFIPGGNSDRFHMFVGNGTGGFAGEEMYFECVNSAWHFGSGNRESFAIGIGANGSAGFARATFSAIGTSSSYFQQDHFITEAVAPNETAFTAVHTVSTPVSTGDLNAGSFKSIVANTGTSRNVAARFNAANGATNIAVLIQAGLLHFDSIPTSSAGLVAGDVYSNAGVLTIV